MPRTVKPTQLDLLPAEPSPRKAKTNGATRATSKKKVKSPVGSAATKASAGHSKMTKPARPRKVRGAIKPPTLGELEASGVLVDRVKAPLSRQEMETGIAFLETDSRAEITTSSTRWIRRIESLGYRPTYVTVFLDAEIRLYDVPKSIIQLPARNRKDRSP